jgi:hypothetical protein
MKGAARPAICLSIFVVVMTVLLPSCLCQEGMAYVPPRVITEFDPEQYGGDTNGSVVQLVLDGDNALSISFVKQEPVDEKKGRAYCYSIRTNTSAKLDVQPQYRNFTEDGKLSLAPVLHSSLELIPAMAVRKAAQKYSFALRLAMNIKGKDYTVHFYLPRLERIRYEVSEVSCNVYELKILGDSLPKTAERLGQAYETLDCQLIIHQSWQVRTSNHGSTGSSYENLIRIWLPYRS